MVHILVDGLFQGNVLLFGDAVSIGEGGGVIDAEGMDFFACFARLILLNASNIRQLIIDDLDVTCRKLLFECQFSLKRFTQLEQLIIHDEAISQTIQSINYSETK